MYFSIKPAYVSLGQWKYLRTKVFKRPMQMFLKSVNANVSIRPMHISITAKIDLSYICSMELHVYIESTCIAIMPMHVSTSSWRVCMRQMFVSARPMHASIRQIRVSVTLTHVRSIKPNDVSTGHSIRVCTLANAPTYKKSVGIYHCTYHCTCLT